MKTILKLLVTALSVVLLTYVLPGVYVDGFFDAFIVAVVLAILRLIVRPVLVFLTLPATIVSLGLFLFVINACIILMADYFVSGFSVSGFFTALIFSILLSFVQSFLHKILGTEEEED
ncbi:MAG: phage holin family protein [Flavobacteriales bacterium]